VLHLKLSRQNWGKDEHPVGGKGRFTMRVVKALLTYIVILLTIFVLIVLFKHHVHPDDALFFAGILAIPATYLWRKYSAVEH
jgi:hypothetical protein